MIKEVQMKKYQRDFLLEKVEEVKRVICEIPCGKSRKVRS